ncbi:MAG: hypothetical protein NT169_11380 [Chloroflexi bacterium]|nr:hypothetical protein [Chloroflexota bacterium]
MNYRIGDSVRVKPGVRDPDNPDFDIGGWQGRVTDLSHANEPQEPTIGLTWDSLTLKVMPKQSIERCAREGLNWAECYLYLEELEPARPRDAQKDVDRVREEIEARVSWLGIGPEGDHIQAVVNSAKSRSERDILAAWRAELERTLRFPFEAVVKEFQDRGPFRAGDRVTVLRFQQIDELYGILAACRKGQRLYEFPLSDLAAQDKKSPNADAIQDYRVWHANR